MIKSSFYLKIVSTLINFVINFLMIKKYIQSSFRVQEWSRRRYTLVLFVNT